MKNFPWRKLVFNAYALLFLFALQLLIFSLLFGNLTIGSFVIRIRYLVLLAVFVFFLNYLNYYAGLKEISVGQGIKGIVSSHFWLISWSFLIFLILYSTFLGNLNILGFVLKIRYLWGLAFILSVLLNFFPSLLRQSGPVFHFDSRILAALGLLMLAAAAFFLAARLEAPANNAAVLAYGFLAWGVLFQLIEYFREQGVETKNHKPNG